MLPKRDSSAPGANFDMANLVKAPATDESGDVASSHLYSEQTLAFSSVMAAVIALIVGFVFGILITRFCDGGPKKESDANNNKTNGSVLSIANGSLGLQGLQKTRGSSMERERAAMQM